MATIRHGLQRDVFDPSEERLVGVLYVTKLGKKKKTSFLCATINKEKPVYATIHQVLNLCCASLSLRSILGNVLLSYHDSLF